MKMKIVLIFTLLLSLGSGFTASAQHWLFHRHSWCSEGECTHEPKRCGSHLVMDGGRVLYDRHYDNYRHNWYHECDEKECKHECKNECKHECGDHYYNWSHYRYHYIHDNEK